MLYDLSMSESTKYEKVKNNYTSTVYVIQEISGTRAGAPKINIMGASHYGQFKFVLPEFSQMIHSPGPLVYTLRQKLKDINQEIIYYLQVTQLLLELLVLLFQTLLMVNTNCSNGINKKENIILLKLTYTRKEK